jgi:LuxR family maltose regulon positive regulatory protein
LTIIFKKMTQRHLLTTKIQIPPLPPKTVQRTRLLEALDRGLQPNIRLTLLSAPAGYGKTTLLSAWVQDRGLSTAWISLDEGDNDPIRFMSYLLAAFESVIPTENLPSPTGESLSEDEIQQQILIPLINHLGHSPRQTILILDDYHWIQSQTTHDHMGYLLDHLPPQVHILVATRADPPLPITRLRGRGQMNELRMEDLRFQIEEAEAFLETFTDLELTSDDVYTLTHRTEGWISGLQMAAASLQVHEDKTAFIRDFSGSHHYIMDYLLDEVLRRQTPQIQAYLLYTSVLPRLCGSLCDTVMEVTGETFPPSQGILKDLERANLFIVPLDAKREWYRYHRLFGDLLQARLQRKDPSSIPTLHRRASEWFEDQNLLDEAVQHALLSYNHVYAADLIERASEEKFMRSETTTFLRWVQRLPEEEIQKRPKLGIYRAWALLLHGAPLSTVEAQLQKGPEESGPPGSSLTLQAFIALSQGQTDHGLELTKQALKTLPEDEIYLRDFATFCAAATQIALGDVERGIQLLEQTSQASQRSGNRTATVMILCELAEFRLRQLQVKEAEKLYQQALSIATDQDGKLLPIAGGPLIGLGDVALERYDLASAEDLLQEGIQHAERWSLISTLNGHLSMAMLHYARGDTLALEDALETLYELAQRFDTSEFDDMIVELLEAGLNVRQGNLEAVQAWVARRDLEDAPERIPSLYKENQAVGRIYKYELPVLARLDIAEDRFEQALKVLEELSSQAERANRPFLQLEAEILKARAFHAMDDTPSSLDALRRALQIAAPVDAARIFLTEGEEFIQLLQAARSGWDSPELIDFTDHLLGKVGLPILKGPTPTQGLLGPLSPRELEVLHLLPSGLTAEELADELIISVNTVRSHLKNIYAKLGVHSRHEAVARATELDLL